MRWLHIILIFDLDASSLLLKSYCAHVLTWDWCISWARGDRPCWGLWDVKIIIWASEIVRVEIVDFMVVCVEIVRIDTWRSSVSVYGPRESPMSYELSIYFRGVSCIYGWESTWHMRHIISWCHIALHLITLFILVDYMLYWWLYITWSLIIDETWLVSINSLV